MAWAQPMAGREVEVEAEAGLLQAQLPKWVTRGRCALCSPHTCAVLRAPSDASPGTALSSGWGGGTGGQQCGAAVGLPRNGQVAEIKIEPFSPACMKIGHTGIFCVATGPGSAGTGFHACRHVWSQRRDGNGSPLSKTSAEPVRLDS